MTKNINRVGQYDLSSNPWEKDEEERTAKNAKTDGAKLLRLWEKATEKLLQEFIRVYYLDEDITMDDIEYWWVAEEIGGVVFINDEHWSLQNITDAFRYNPTREQLWRWHWDSIDAAMGKQAFPNLKNWLKLNKEA